MCGIFGIITNNNHTTYDYLTSSINHLFKLSQIRGKESAGIAIYNFNNKEINVFKQAIKPTLMIKSNNYKKFYDSTTKKLFANNTLKTPLALIGHCRMITNGGNEIYNCQPVYKNGVVCAHNGIIVNDKEIWNENLNLDRRYNVDTEIITELINKYYNDFNCLGKSIQQVYKELDGEASIAMLFSDSSKMILSSNTGSLYLLLDKHKNTVVFASEMYLLNKYLYKFNRYFEEYEIFQVKPYTAYIIDIINMKIDLLNLKDEIYSCYSKELLNEKLEIKDDSIDLSKRNISNKKSNGNNDNYYKGLLEYNINDIRKMKRCKKCLLPETFPFIKFDDDGVCNYCKSYDKDNYQGKEELQKSVEQYKNKDGEIPCLLAFSGGRDSCYGLYYVKNILKMKPIAYTYDWGMVTDLARRNQAKMCGKLGVEHIVVSADIAKKRENVRKNVNAWLKRPQLGTIPLFMAGDKQYFYYANKLSKYNKLKLVVLCDNPLEITNFKYGFCGVKPKLSQKGQSFSLPKTSKVKMILYYLKEFILNPAYINSSVFDTIGGFISYYLIPHNYLNLFKYIQWDEKTVETVLLDEFEWEIANDTKSTWRIGDGTAAFYNYIYFTVAGFTENDTFRSNQIREGKISREEALKLAEQDNKPRYESIKWYLDMIGLNFEDTIKIINHMPKLYK